MCFSPSSIHMCPRVPISVFPRLPPARLLCEWQIKWGCDYIPVPGAASNTLRPRFSVRPPGMTSCLTAWVFHSVWFSCSVYSLRLLTTQPAGSCSCVLIKQMPPSFVVLLLCPSLWKSYLKILHRNSLLCLCTDTIQFHVFHYLDIIKTTLRRTAKTVSFA